MNASEGAGRPSGESHSRKAFLRDAAVFHGKLFLDGLCDVILFPTALVAVAADLIRRDEPLGRHFYDVVHLGKQSEQWINLYEVADRLPAPDSPRRNIDAPNLDQMVDDLETKLKNVYDKGEISAAARQAIDQAMEATRRAIRNSTDRG